LLVFDVDGVFRDDSLYYGAGGEELKVFDVQDGQGVKRLLKAGLAAAVISGRASAAVTRLMQDLGIPHLFQGDEDKLPILEKLLQKLGLGLDETAHVGDDLPDLPLLQRVGLGVAVANARPVVKAAAHHVTAAHGGRGAVREVCELILEAQGKA